MNIGFSAPWALLLGITALLPLFGSGQAAISYSTTLLIPNDPLSTALDRLLRFSAAAAALCLSLGIAGPYLHEQWVERTGTGAHIVLLLDRSSSMNENFSGRYMGGGAQQTKGAIARKLLAEFVGRREHDLFAMIDFSAAPMYVMPFTQDRTAILAAIEAASGRGHGVTNIAPGLAMALDFYSGKPFTGSRIVLLVSDGAARIEEETRDQLRQWFQETQATLYWIYLRNPRSVRLSEKPANPGESTTPEYFLHQYFQDLGVPYRAFEAENPEALQRAITEVEQLENLPLRYLEKLPRRDISGYCHAAALIFLALLLGAKALEVKSWPT
ncbi:vWA domain-containing protein [Methylocaldum sp.]|uniref:vWA domain-containing protein n=1 Tax=Methylocaldum sp. TaxID=1969727 RepID=UPI002D4F5CD7|nr:vWA domain-containing protein [Methylocaldum sp.]HYE34609.1 vWA domain-containing protein [Methylocaldum sp.]